MNCIHNPFDMSGDCVFCDVPRIKDWCDYCQTDHALLDFGYDFSGERTLVCADRLNDVVGSGYGQYQELEAGEIA